MKVCIIGDGLVSLTLANVLIKKDLYVDIYSIKKNGKYKVLINISRVNFERMKSKFSDSIVLN